MAWLAHISDWQAETADPGEFLDSLRFEIGAKEVYVFTPKGRVIGLPAGATPVDFAYAVHTEVGHRTMGAKVNGRLVPLESELNSGDVVEVFTSKNPDSGPSKDWLNFVKSPRARNKIRQWFTKERRDEAIEQGRDAIARAMRKQNLPLQKLMSQESFAEVAAQLRYDDVSALYAAVGEGHVSTQSVIEKVVALVRDVDDVDEPDLPIPVRTRPLPRHSDSGVLVRGAPDILVKLAEVLHPVPGDEIVGFITRGSGVSVHQANVPQRAVAAARARAHDRRRVGADLEERVPRADPDRGARPGRPALRRHPRALRAPREHPLGERVDLDRPPRPQPLRVRDGRHDPPRPRAQRRAAHRRRLRRLPRERRLSAIAARRLRDPPARAAVRAARLWGIRRRSSARAAGRLDERGPRRRDRGRATTSTVDAVVEARIAQEVERVRPATCSGRRRTRRSRRRRSDLADDASGRPIGDPRVERARRTARRRGSGERPVHPRGRQPLDDQRRAQAGATAAARSAGRSGSSTGAQPAPIDEEFAVERAAQSSASGRSSVPSTAGSLGHDPCCGIDRRRDPRTSSCGEPTRRGAVEGPAGPRRDQPPTALSHARRASSASRGPAIAFGVARRLGRGQLGLELRDRVLQLAEHALGARLLLGVLALPALVLERPDVVLDLAQAVLDGAHLVARHPADLVPAALDAVERGARLLGVGLGEELLGLVEQRELLGEVGAVLLVVLRVDLGLGLEEHVARGLELRPQRVVDLLAGAAGLLPLVEEAR